MVRQLCDRKILKTKFQSKGLPKTHIHRQQQQQEETYRATAPEAFELSNVKLLLLPLLLESDIVFVFFGSTTCVSSILPCLHQNVTHFFRRSRRTSMCDTIIEYEEIGIQTKFPLALVLLVESCY